MVDDRLSDDELALLAKTAHANLSVPELYE